MNDARFLTPSQNKNFFMFVSAQCLSFIGKALIRFVLPLYILLETGDSALMGTILATTAIPSILIAPFSGVLVDRVKKNHLLATVNITTSLGIVLFYFAKQHFGIISATIFMLLIVLTADSLTALTGKSSVTAVSRPENLVKANSILFLGISICAIVTPILGGFALGGIGINAVLIISFGFLLVATFINLVTDIPTSTIKSNGNIFQTVISDLTSGFKLAFTLNPKIGRVIVLVNMMFCIVLFPLTSMTLSILITGYFGRNEEFLGVSAAIVGIGGIIGTLSINRLGEKVGINLMRPILMASTLILIPLTMTFTFGAPQLMNIILLLIVVFLMFFVNSVLAIIGRAYFGRKIPANMIGKIMGINSMFVLIGVSLGGYLYGFLFDIFIHSPGIVFLIITVATGIMTWMAKIE